ncbi:MAG: hypothetical protein DIU78_023035 [Pseudomonadota bacterium]
MSQRTLLVALTVFGLSGCFMIQGRAEMVKRDRTGGVLALKGDKTKAMEDAKAQMAANCPDGYEIVGEEMVKVGEATQTEEEVDLDKKGASKSGASITQDVTEHRITYVCKSAEQSAAAEESASSAAAEESAAPEAAAQ